MPIISNLSLDLNIPHVKTYMGYESARQDIIHCQKQCSILDAMIKKHSDKLKTISRYDQDDDLETIHAIFLSMIVTYLKPFNRSDLFGIRIKKSDIPILFPEFKHHELHVSLKTLRNTFVSHGDESYAEQVSIQSMVLTRGNKGVRLIISPKFGRLFYPIDEEIILMSEMFELAFKYLSNKADASLQELRRTIMPVHLNGLLKLRSREITWEGGVNSAFGELNPSLEDLSILIDEME